MWFDESYRGKPFLVDLDAGNLEVVWANRVKIRTRIDENSREWVNVHDLVKAEYQRLKLTPEQVEAEMQEAKDFINRHPELDHIKTKKCTGLILRQVQFSPSNGFRFVGIFQSFHLQLNCTPEHFLFLRISGVF
jgi:hypothetical protein